MGEPHTSHREYCDCCTHGRVSSKSRLKPLMIAMHSGLDRIFTLRDRGGFSEFDGECSYEGFYQ